MKGSKISHKYPKNLRFVDLRNLDRTMKDILARSIACLVESGFPID